MPVPWMALFWVALGSALGGVLRYAITLATARASGFPWWTLSINTAGCLLIGYLSTLNLPPYVRALLVPGLCGGFTTFSAFSLEFLTLQRENRLTEALAYVAASVLLCLAAVAAGAALGRRA